MPIELIQSFLQQANATGTKSTVLTDLRWFTFIVISGLLVAIKTSAPEWVLILFSVLLCLVALLYISAYIFFAIRSPDALRSEKYTLTKMAIEHSMKGDNLSGLIDSERDTKVPELPANTLKKDGV